jgi:hypothetical protein
MVRPTMDEVSATRHGVYPSELTQANQSSGIPSRIARIVVRRPRRYLILLQIFGGSPELSSIASCLARSLVFTARWSLGNQAGESADPGGGWHALLLQIAAQVTLGSKEHYFDTRKPGIENSGDLGIAHSFVVAQDQCNPVILWQTN